MKATKTKTNIPMKRGTTTVLHTRADENDVETLKRAGADIPEIVRQAISKAARQVTTTTR